MVFADLWIGIHYIRFCVGFKNGFAYRIGSKFVDIWYNRIRYGWHLEVQFLVKSPFVNLQDVFGTNIGDPSTIDDNFFKKISDAMLVHHP